MEVTATNFGPAHLVGIRHVGPYHEIGAAFGKLGAWLGANQIPMEAMLGFYYDDPRQVAPADLRSDAAAVVPEGVAIPEGNDVRIFELPERKYATATHLGSYSGLGDAWQAFEAAVQAAGFTMTDDPCFEVYVNDCTKVPEAEVRTDLYVPIS